MSDPRLTIFTTERCPICERAKVLLEKWGIGYRNVRVDGNRAGLVEMARVARGARTVPQFAIDGRWIGGFPELTELHRDGRLATLIGETQSDSDNESG